MPEADPELAQLLASCMTASETPIAVADARDPDFPLIYVNAAFERLTGYPAGDVLGRNCRFLQGADTDPAVVRGLGTDLHAGRSAHAQLLNYRADATAYWSEIHISPVRDTTGAITSFMAILHDVTDRVAATEKMAYAATRDPLTGLANRAAFAAEVERELVRATRHGRSAAVLFLDVDRFKGVNDSHGHLTGDRYLVHVARTLQRRVRSGDFCARHGGDEFTVLLTDLPGDGADAAARVVDALRDALDEPFVIDGVDHRTTVTIGAALFPRDGRTMHDLVDTADADMYRRKPSSAAMDRPAR